MHDGSEKEYEISVHNFKFSPFYPAYVRPGIQLGVYNNRLYPWQMGDDTVTSYWQLRRNAAMYDVPERPLEIVGPDAERLLNRVLTRDIAKVLPGRAAYGIACLPGGGILMDGVLMRLDKERFYYVQADGDFLAWLMAHADGMDVMVRDPESWVIQIQGPKSIDILSSATKDTLPNELKYFDVARSRIGDHELIISRTGWTNELGFELYTNREVDGVKLWNDLLEVGKPYGMIATGGDSMDVRRIEAGILDYGVDMDVSTTPFDVGLGGFVDFAKEDFVGRSALWSASRERLLFGIRVQSAAPKHGCQVFAGQSRVGYVTNGAWSPTLECGVAYVRLEYPSCHPGDGVTVQMPDGARVEGQIVELPFFDREKKIPRGLSSDLLPS